MELKWRPLYDLVNSMNDSRNVKGYG